MSPAQRLTAWADREPRGLLDRPGVLLGVLNAGLGAVLLAGAPARTSSPSFRVPLQLLSPDAWGVAFLTAALLSFSAVELGRKGAVLVGACAGLHALWATALLLSATGDPKAALTGIVTYLWATLVDMWTAWRLARQVT